MAIVNLHHASSDVMTDAKINKVRTTIDLEEDLLSRLKPLAREQGVTLGQLISALTRRSLPEQGVAPVRNGVRIFAPQNSGKKTNLQIVNALRDDE